MTVPGRGKVNDMDLLLIRHAELHPCRAGRGTGRPVSAARPGPSASRADWPGGWSPGQRPSTSCGQARCGGPWRSATPVARACGPGALYRRRLGRMGTASRASTSPSRSCAHQRPSLGRASVSGEAFLASVDDLEGFRQGGGGHHRGHRRRQLRASEWPSSATAGSSTCTCRGCSGWPARTSSCPTKRPSAGWRPRGTGSDAGFR